MNLSAQTVFWLSCWCSCPIGVCCYKKDSGLWIVADYGASVEGSGGRGVNSFPALTVMYAISAEQEPFHFGDAPCLQSSAHAKRIR